MRFVKVIFQHCSIIKILQPRKKLLDKASDYCYNGTSAHLILYYYRAYNTRYSVRPGNTVCGACVKSYVCSNIEQTVWKCGDSVKIAGLQKLTLLDYPAHTACTVFLWGCNFRCPFCHNAPLVTMPCKDEITEDSLLSFLETRRGKLDGVCITGGEPTIHPDLEALICKIRAMGFQVKLDTNGTNPKMLRTLCEAGLLDMVAMDVKNAPEKYSLTAGTEHSQIDAVNESVQFLLRGTVPYEFRTTIVRGYHETADMERIGQWIRGADAYYLQAFRDSGALIASGCGGLPPAEMQKLLDAVKPYVPNARLRGID